MLLQGSSIACDLFSPLLPGHMLLLVAGDERTGHVSQQLTLHVEEAARCLRPCVDSKLGSGPHSASSNSSCLGALHAPPLQAQWQAALAAALRTTLPWLETSPPPQTSSTADKLLSAARRLAALAAGSLQAAAEGTDPATALEQPPALALAEALMDYLDIPVERLACALQRDCSLKEPGEPAYDIAPFRAAADALRALASTTVAPLLGSCASALYCLHHLLCDAGWPSQSQSCHQPVMLCDDTL
jgi:hypothetical protein